MAERRMFAKAIIGSGKFLRMPPSTRLLYYDLGMYADDDGVVEAFTIMRQTGATEDDLRVLVSKGFVKILNDELVTFITDWNVNNLIRKDRYNESLYKDLLIQVNNGMVGRMATSGKPDGNQRLPQVRIGKVSIDKDSINNVVDIDPPDAEPYKHEQPDALIIYSQQCLAGMSLDNVNDMISYRDVFSDDMIREAINLTNANGSRNWSYCRKILRKWEQSGFKSLADVKAAEEKREQGKAQDKGGNSGAGLRNDNRVTYTSLGREV